MDIGVDEVGDVPEGVMAAIVAGARQEGVEVITTEQGSRSSRLRTPARHPVPLWRTGSAM
jgi:hypothetical protein